MTPARRWAFLLGGGLLVILLVGGRWVAVESAERAWAATVSGGSSYLVERDLARLVAGFFLLVGITWGTGNLLLVYRAIGSVQLPRRLGNLEIVEAVPQRVLFAGTIASGLVYGSLLSLGTGDWWMPAALAAAAPRFGIADPLLHRDVGYYVARLPWAERLHGFALVATVSAALIVALLYLGMESLRFRRWLPYGSAHARGHLGLLLAALGLTLTWGALLDPAETVAGWHGALTRGILAVRLPAAPVVTALAVTATLVSLVWAARERPRLLVASWGALAGVAVLAYGLLPSALGGAAAPGGARTAADAALAADEQRFERLAFALDSLAERSPPGFPGPAAALAALPQWDAARITTAAARRRELWGPKAVPAVAALALRGPPGGPGPAGSEGGRPGWVVASRPDLDTLAHVLPLPDWREVHRGAWARSGPPVVAWERDSGLAFVRLATRDSASWFGPGFHEFAVAAPDSWPRLGRAGLPLVGVWRRLALAWALQSPELARRETDGLVLLWHRDVRERLERLAPFARFEEPTPVIADDQLWWLAYGYLEAPGFPLGRPLVEEGRAVGYVHASFVGVVGATTGDTRLFLAPGADSLGGAWARILAPLIRPADSLAGALRAALPYPRRAFRLAAALVARWRPDSAEWLALPRQPFELAAPALAAAPVGPGSLTRWLAQGFATGEGRELAALLAGAVAARGPRLYLWQPRPRLHLPAVLVGSPNETAPGVLRLWSAAESLFSAQPLFAESATAGAPSRLDTLFLTWGGRQGQGPTAAAALRDLLAAGAARALADTSLGGRWQAARQLAAQADAALEAGDVEAFGRYYAQLKELLGVGRRKLAPARGRR